MPQRQRLEAATDRIVGATRPVEADDRRGGDRGQPARRAPLGRPAAVRRFGQ